MDKPIAVGKVLSLCINGQSVERIYFDLEGPRGDRHSGFTRLLSGHDGGYIKTSSLKKGARSFNWRSWTGLSQEETSEVERVLGVTIPQGCLLENITVSGIQNFSQLAPTTRLVFPEKYLGAMQTTQTILAVWEENGPCGTVGKRLADYHKQETLKTRFVASAQNKRGVMGIVIAAGYVDVGDTVLVYPPIK